MMKKTVLFTAVLLVAFSPALAEEVEIQPLEENEAEEPEVSTGWFTPDSAFYGIETAVDNAGMALGTTSPGDVAEKRAAEADAMIEAGNSEAAERAANGLENAAERAGEADIEGVERAQNSLQTTMENAPEEAQEGLQTALDNVSEATEPAPEETGAPEDVGEEPIDEGLPEDVEELEEFEEQPAEEFEEDSDQDQAEETEEENGQDQAE